MRSVSVRFEAKSFVRFDVLRLSQHCFGSRTRACSTAGDDYAFAEIIKRYQRKIFGIVLGCVHNRSDVEEITQDTFVRAHQALARFRGDSPLATWLHRIAINRARNHYWFLHRRGHIQHSLDARLDGNSKMTLSEVVASDAPNPAEEMVSEEYSFAVTTCIEKLRTSERDILLRRSVLNRSYAEIAEALGIAVGTVKSRIARARASLRRQMNLRYPELAPGLNRRSRSDVAEVPRSAAV
jgi:RNA polymerase sigma-70 factor, ECF subfamily